MKIILPISFAILVRLLFGWSVFDDFTEVMSWTFFLGVPTAVGALFVYFSKAEKADSALYCIAGPWIPITLIIVLTIVFGIEGWGCWIMISPLFYLFASIGGMTAGLLKRRKSPKNEKLNLSLLVLLPFVAGPIERQLPREWEVYTTHTAIVIEAPAERIWDNVVSVRKISPSEDNTKLTAVLGFPKPVEAVLDTAAVGGYREARFERGLIFRETVSAYRDKEFMRFSIRANTYEIPSTTLDEHILIGGDYFDMLDGTYELKRLAENRYELILYSNFSMKTTFNGYAGLWGHWIMEDIQDNILQVIKRRSENP